MRRTSSLGSQKPLKQTTTLRRSTAKTKKPKTKSVSKLKKELDVVFGRFIKYRDGKMVDGEWVCVCVTCNKRFVYRDRDGKRYMNIQAGHFMSRSYSATRFDERNVHAQCSYDNKWRAGEQYKMSLYIDATYKLGTAAELANLADAGFNLKQDWLREKLDHYKLAIAKYEQMWDN